LIDGLMVGYLEWDSRLQAGLAHVTETTLVEEFWDECCNVKR